MLNLQEIIHYNLGDLIFRQTSFTFKPIRIAPCLLTVLYVWERASTATWKIKSHYIACNDFCSLQKNYLHALSAINHPRCICQEKELATFFPEIWKVAEKFYKFDKCMWFRHFVTIPPNRDWYVYICGTGIQDESSYSDIMSQSKTCPNATSSLLTSHPMTDFIASDILTSPVKRPRDQRCNRYSFQSI